MLKVQRNRRDRLNAQVIVVQVVFNNRPWIEPVFSAIFNQTYKDFNVVAVISGNADGSKELIQSKFPEAKSRTVDEFWKIRTLVPG